MRYLIIIILFLCGCNPTKQANRLILNHPKEASEAFRKQYPCIPLVVKHDSSGRKGYVDTLESMLQFYKELLDNVEPDTLQIHDTSKIEVRSDCESDFKKQYLYYKKLYEIANMQAGKLANYIKYNPPLIDTIVVQDKSLDATIEGLNKENKKLNSKLHSSKNWNIYLLIALAISLILNILLIKFK